MKPVDVKSSAYIDFNKESTKEDTIFDVGDHVIISKYKSIFAEGSIPNWSEDVFAINKVKNTVPWSYVIRDLNGKVDLGTLDKKEYQKKNQREFRVEKVIKRKGNKLYVTWKGYNN